MATLTGKVGTETGWTGPGRGSGPGGGGGLWPPETGQESSGMTLLQTRPSGRPRFIKASAIWPAQCPLHNLSPSEQLWMMPIIESRGLNEGLQHPHTLRLGFWLLQKIVHIPMVFCWWDWVSTVSLVCSEKNQYESEEALGRTMGTQFLSVLLNYRPHLILPQGTKCVTYRTWFSQNDLSTYTLKKD